MKKIMIVEDEVALREAFVMIFDLQGYKTAEADNGQEALNMLRTFKPDIIILDILMPILGGIEFLEQAQLGLHFPGTQVLVLSNLSDDQTMRKIQDLEVEHYILKSSVTPNTLVEKVESILGSS
jgi:CheY-like chemotaxis protein